MIMRELVRLPFARSSGCTRGSAGDVRPLVMKSVDVAGSDRVRAAAMFSGLTVDDFMRRSSLIELNRQDLLAVMPVIEAFGRVEGLDGHVNSARVRFEGT